MGQRRKHLLQSTFSHNVQPPAESQQIVRAVGARGSNIIEVEYPNGSTTLCMMPAKFNRKLWVRRGGYLIIEPSPEAEQDASSRVTGTICAVLYDEHMKQLKKMPGVWPSEFTGIVQTETASTANGIMPQPHSEGSEAADELEAGSTAVNGLHLQPSCRQQWPAQHQLQHPDPRQSTAAHSAAAAAEVDDSEAQLAARGSGSRGSGKVSSSEGHFVDNDAQQVDRGSSSCDSSGEEDDGLPPLQQINNRRVVHYEASEDSDSEDAGINQQVDAIGL